MYSSALCPQCGAAIYGTASGVIQTKCNACPWSGAATFYLLPPGSYIPPNLGTIFTPNIANIPNIVNVANPTNVAGKPTVHQPQPFQTVHLIDLAEDATDPLAARREQAQQRLYLMATEVMSRVFALSAAGPEGADGWNAPQWLRYQRLQDAHAALFEALGGRRMGEYRVDSQRVQTALVELLFRQLLLLDGALQGPDKGTSATNGKGR